MKRARLVIGMIAIFVVALAAAAQEPAPIEQRLVDVLPPGWIHDGVVVTPGGVQLSFRSLFNRPGAFPLESFETASRTYAAVWTLSRQTTEISPARHIRQAYVAPTGAQWRVFVDGKVSNSYVKILDGSLTISPSNARSAYVARDAAGWRAVIDGREGPTAEKVGPPLFSSDSRHVAYIAGRDGKYWIHRDEKVGKAYAEIRQDSLAFSRTSDHLAYVARVGKQYVMVLDGHVGPRFDQIGPPVFSPNGRHLAYAARQGKRWLIVLDGKPGPLMDYAWGPLFSADSLRLAYSARAGRKSRVVVDGKAGESYDAVYDYQFSPDGKRLAYIARAGTRYCAVVDGVEGKLYNRIPTDQPCLRFSPDSKRVAYVAQNAGKYFVVADGAEGDRFDFIEAPVFSPDSRRLAYVVVEEGKAFIVVDGRAEPAFQAVGMPGFSPDGRLLAYTAKRDGQWGTIGVENGGAPFNFIFAPTSDAGIELSFGARELLTYRVDLPIAQQWVIFRYTLPAQTAVAGQGGIFWAQNGKRTVLRYVAVKNEALYWVEKPIL
ncbi:MAG: hypothetical protein ACYC6A_25245 [Armatimonadota bacterium]